MCEFKDLTRIYDFADNLEEIVKLVKLAESKIDLYNKEDNYKNIIWMRIRSIKHSFNGTIRR